jgi:serine/threonine protein kinase
MIDAELFQAFQTEDNIYLVMEFVGGGSLFNV